MTATVIPLRSSERDDYAKLYIQCMQAVASYWAGHMLTSDSTILQFIIDRTLRWGKAQEVITYNQICNGVHTRTTGETVSAGVRLSRATVFRAVGRLEHMGLVAITRTQSTRQGYESNVFEINFKMIMGRDITMLKIPKKQRVKRAPPLSHSETTPSLMVRLPLSQKCTTNIHKDNLTEGINDSKNVPTAAAFGTVEEALTAARRKTQQRRDAKAEQLVRKFTHATALAAWQQQMLRHYPGVPVTNLTVREFEIFRRNMKLNLRGVDPRVFFDWAIDNWGTMRSGRLAWMNKKQELIPVTPRLDTLTKYIRVFARAYADDQTTALAAAPAQPPAPKEDTTDLLKQLHMEQRKTKKLEAANARLMGLKAQAPKAPTKLQVVTKNSMAEAKSIYDDQGDTGPWQE